MTTEQIKQRYDIVGNDPQLLMAIHKANQVAPTDLSILITGESGVGKDVFSRIVHDNSLRKGKKLIAVNCGAIPEGTIDSELFGHEKGSFTGANEMRKGYFEEADKARVYRKVQEALKSGRTIDKVFIADGETDRSLQRLAAQAKEAGAVIVPVDRRKLDAMSTTRAHQGVIALAAAHVYYSIDDILSEFNK